MSVSIYSTSTNVIVDTNTYPEHLFGLGNHFQVGFPYTENDPFNGPDLFSNDNFLFSGNYPSYSNDICNCGTQADCLMDCYFSFGYKYRY